LNGGKGSGNNGDPRLTRSDRIPQTKDPKARSKFGNARSLPTSIVEKIDCDEGSFVLKNKAGERMKYVLHDKLILSRLDQEIPITDVQVGDELMPVIFDDTGKRQGFLCQLPPNDVKNYPDGLHPGLYIHGVVESVNPQKRTVRVKWNKPDTSNMVGYNIWKKDLARTDQGPKPVLWGDAQWAMDGIEKLLEMAKTKDTLTFKLHPRGLVLRNGLVKHLEDIKVGDFVSTRSAPNMYGDPEIPVPDIFVSEPLPSSLKSN